MWNTNLKFSRRQLLKLSASGLVLPKLASGAPNSSERKFLFVFCDGGWDPTFVFAPLYDNPHVYSDPTGTVTSANGLTFIESPERPMVNQFFNDWADKCLIINGIDVSTVAHDRGKRLLMTGKPQGPDDWGALISAYSEQTWTAPHLVVSGPTFVTYHPDSIVRIGEDGELDYLLTGQVTYGPPETLYVDNRSESLISQYLQNRSRDRFDAASQDVHMQRFARNLGRSQPQIESLIESTQDISFVPSEGEYGYACDENFMGSAQIALQCFEAGLTRCAIVEDQGFCRMRWDSHGAIGEQSWHYDLLFDGLSQLMTELHSRYAPSGNLLADEVTVVVCSELGRHPQLNAMGGKHHWPVTTAMIIGGVTGGRTVGGFDEQVLASPIDLASGEPDPNGTKLTPGHLGATLLALADIDPAPFVDASPIMGIIQ